MTGQNPIRFFGHLCCLSILAIGSLSALSAAASPPRIAVLGVFLQNDNAELEPTTDAERARQGAVREQLSDALRVSRQYDVVPVPQTVEARIVSGPSIGACGGCERDHGRAIGVDRVAWIEVQKVSNLILNMNVYVVDVASGQQSFRHSVDIRGNTDESWRRSLSYLVKNYLLPQQPSN